MTDKKDSGSSSKKSDPGPAGADGPDGIAYDSKHDSDISDQSDTDDAQDALQRLIRMRQEMMEIDDDTVTGNGTDMEDDYDENGHDDVDDDDSDENDLYLSSSSRATSIKRGIRNRQFSDSARDQEESDDEEYIQERGADQDEEDQDDYDDEEDDEQEREAEDDDHHGSFLGLGSSSIPGLGQLGFMNQRLFSALTNDVLGFSSRVRPILSALRDRDDSSAVMSGLEELADNLLISNEDSLSTYFPVDSFAQELVKILVDQTFEEQPEILLLACRNLSNMMEVLSASVNSIVRHGAIPALCQKLFEIQYIDLAEQALSTLERISIDCPREVFYGGGLPASLTYLDFFSSHVQRSALTIAANICRDIPADAEFYMIKDTMPILENVLSNSDEKVCEKGCVCVCSIISSYADNRQNLQQLASDELVKKLLSLANPSSSLASIHSIQTDILKAVAVLARASSKAATLLLNEKVADLAFQILTNHVPAFDKEDTIKQDNGAIIQSLIHASRNLLIMAITIIRDILPVAYFDSTESSDYDAHFVCAGPYRFSRENLTKEEVARLGERTEALSAVPEKVLQHFCRVSASLMLDIFSTSVDRIVRQNVLTTLIRIVCLLDADTLNEVVLHIDLTGLIGSIFSQPENPWAVVGGLEIGQSLLMKLPSIYRPTFYRIGIIGEVENMLANINAEEEKDPSDIEIDEGEEQDEDFNEDDEDDEDDDEYQSELGESVSNGVSSTSFKKDSSGHKGKFSSSDMAPLLKKDAELLLSIYRSASGDDDDYELEAAHTIESLKAISSKLLAGGSTAQGALGDFAASVSTTSSFELMSSGVLEAIVCYLTNEVNDYQNDFYTEFSKMSSHGTENVFTALIEKLQEILARSERLEVVSVGGDVNNRSGSAGMLARQIKIKLVADSSVASDLPELPDQFRSIALSIQAIATFKTLEEFLKSKVALGRIAGFHNHRLPLDSDRLEKAFGSGLPFSSALAALARGHAGGRVDRSEAASGSDEEIADDIHVNEAESSETPSINESADIALPVFTARSRNSPREGSGISSPSDNRGRNSGSESLALPSSSARTEQADSESSEVAALNPVGTLGNPRRTYASVARTKYGNDDDWHFEFAIDGEPIPHDSTIINAVYRMLQNALEKKEKSHNDSLGKFPQEIWYQTFEVTYRKVEGQAPPSPKGNEMDAEDVDPSLTVPSSFNSDEQTSVALRLLSVFFDLNSTSNVYRLPPLANESVFISSKLTAKLNRQLDEPLIMASGIMPPWMVDATRLYPFLFPFDSRYVFLQSTSFGYSRSMNRWQNSRRDGALDGRNTQSSRRDDGRPPMGRLLRQKVRVSRHHILHSAVKVMDLCGSSPNILEVEFFDEVGTGLGPTLEFYTLVSREFALKKYKMWRVGESSNSEDSPYVNDIGGLFPSPMTKSMMETSSGKKVLQLYSTLGTFIARSMIDSRMIDIHISPNFFKAALGRLKPTLNSLKSVDGHLSASLGALLDMKKDHADNIENLMLDFTLPGYPSIELVEGGSDLIVNASNVDDYIDLIVNMIMGDGITAQSNAFCEGFSKVFPITALQAFTPAELTALCGQGDEDWAASTIYDAIKADHGYNKDSIPIQYLISVMSEFDNEKRRKFLQFMTGSPKLPIGGFQALNPCFTVVLKQPEEPFGRDEFLPSVMTCANYLKLPEYSSREILEERLLTAMYEGQGAFLLS